MRIRLGLTSAIVAAGSFLPAGPLGADPPLGIAPFSIAQVLSAPFPSDVIRSPAANAVAWVQNAVGISNVWVARAPRFEAVQITHFAADGQEIGELAWDRDGRNVFFTRGGDPDNRGTRTDPVGEPQVIWEAGLSGNTVQIGEGHSAAVAPDGSTVAWIFQGRIWSKPLSGGEPKPAPLVDARGTANHLVWSPEGGRLAFVSDRGDHAFIAVYDMKAKSLRFLDPSVDTDQSPVWSADGKQIAFIRIPADPTDFEFGPKRTGQPWSIRIADARSGEGREVWRAAEGRGSVFRQMTAFNQLLWMTGDRIVFPWERDGWLHLYSISCTYSISCAVAGAAPVLLTPGSFEIEQVAAAPDGESVAFSSNQGDTDRRHLWRVAFDSRPPRRLTSGDGIEWAPTPLTGGRVVLLHSDAKMPARAAMLSNGALNDLAPSTIPRDFPAAELVEPQPVVFAARDGLQLHGQLFLPPNGGSGRHPAVVFFHGGSRRQMLLGWHYMEYYSQAYGFNQYLASRGYVVLAVNYRSGIGYGSDFREAPNFGATGASEFNDVLGTGDYLRGRADVDSARIGVWGGSYGGYLTALALARASDLFAVGVDLHGVHDWNLEITKAAPARDREKRERIEQAAFESSPLASIGAWRSPVLLIQGDDDRTVPFAETVQLVEALRKQGVPFEQLIFPDEVHEFLFHAHWLAAYRAADAFLGRYLKPGQ